MEHMIVILNNGTRISIPKECVQSISQAMMSGEIKEWNIQIDARNKEISSLINMKHVSAICLHGDIMPESSDTLQQIGLFLDTLPVDDAHGRFWAEKFRRFVLDKKSTL